MISIFVSSDGATGNANTCLRNVYILGYFLGGRSQFREGGGDIAACGGTIYPHETYSFLLIKILKNTFISESAYCLLTCYLGVIYI